MKEFLAKLPQEMKDNLLAQAEKERDSGADIPTVEAKTKVNLLRELTSPRILQKFNEEISREAGGGLSGMSTPSIGIVRYTAKPPKFNQGDIIARIARNETSIISEEKKYSYNKPSGSKALGKDLGKYQVTEGTLKSYAPRYLGKQVTAKEFLSSPELQETYIRNFVSYHLARGATPEEIYAIHRGGPNHDPEDENIKKYVEMANKPFQ